MLYFLSDYTEGCHPKVLEALAETNLISQPGYGEDLWCRRAADRIRALCGAEADVHFLTGGTQANLVVISSLLRRHEAVIAAETGHINVHEAAAIEYTGRKVIALPAHEGKLDAGELDAYMAAFYADATHEHMPFPGMVYISHPTELGTLYSKAELTALYEVCRRRELPLFLDGARLGYGLMSPASDLTIRDVAALTDVFYIGGLQFAALFTDDLYGRISREAVELAMALKAAFVKKGYPLYADSPTNQQFVILTKEQKERLEKDAAFNVWAPLPDGRFAVRFVTSWATRPEDIEALRALL